MLLENFSKNDVIRFMTNAPQIHVMEMFGHGEPSPDDIKKEEYAGRIKGVIDNGASYLISTISPTAGFICIADAVDVIRKVALEELTPEELAKYNDRMEQWETPNVYINDASEIEPQICGVAEACERAAANAVKALFPEYKVVEIKKEKDSRFTREWYLNNMAHFLRDELKDKPEYIDLTKRRDFLAGKFQEARFKQYHSVTVAVERPTIDDDRELDKIINEHLRKHFGKDAPVEVKEKETVTVNWLVAVDMNYEEVSVLRDIEDRSAFFRSLGPEFYDMSEAADDFRSRCLQVRFC